MILHKIKSGISISNTFMYVYSVFEHKVHSNKCCNKILKIPETDQGSGLYPHYQSFKEGLIFLPT